MSAAADPLRQRLDQRGLDWIVPDWPGPANVRALMTTRNADVVDGMRRSMNLGRGDGDQAGIVARNRVLLRDVTCVDPLWLSQTHGTTVAIVGAAPQSVAADAAIAAEPGAAAAVRVADCLPVLFATRDGGAVGAAHAGWRGLCGGVLEATVEAMRSVAHERGGAHTAGDDIVAWMGPAIGPASFEVGDDVLSAFVQHDPRARDAFMPHPRRPAKWLADLYALARMRLRGVGIESISGGAHCTMRESDRFFSYRRDKSVERMAALIWIEPTDRG